MASKKKHFKYDPNRPIDEIETQRTKARVRLEPSDPISIERETRQLLAQKISGTLVGTWLLVAEHMRLGTYDLLCGWTGRRPDEVQPRLAMQIVNEAALCSNGIRKGRSLSQRGFEVANGLYFLGSDKAIHELLNEHTVHEAQELQVALGKIRRANGDFPGKLLALDPHRMRSYTKRQTTRRQNKSDASSRFKTSQTFFCIDVDSAQPMAFTLGPSPETVTQATPSVLPLVQRILPSDPGEVTILADTEHYCVNLIEYVQLDTPFDILVLMARRASLQKRLQSIPPDQFTRRWAGYATTRIKYQFPKSKGPPVFLYVDRSGERPEDYSFTAFLATADRDELEPLTKDYPKRWHGEEFFNAYQALGWKRAGTQNLNIRYGQMTMALFAQAATHQLRQRLGDPFLHWDAEHFARDLLMGLKGDIRVIDDTILVTFYDPPHAQLLRHHFSRLPHKLSSENIDPRVPWLYDFKLDFRFK